MDISINNEIKITVEPKEDISVSIDENPNITFSGKECTIEDSIPDLITIYNLSKI